MRYVRRFPPLLRVGLVLPLVALLYPTALIMCALPWSPCPQELKEYVNSAPVTAIAFNFVYLSAACFIVAASFNDRRRRPERRWRFPLDSWQRQALALALAAAPALCGLTIAIAGMGSQTFDAIELVVKIVTTVAVAWLLFIYWLLALR